MPESKFDQIWDMYVSTVKEKASARAQEIAEKDGRTEIAAPDIFDAIREYIPGNPIAGTPSAPSREPGWWNKNVTGFIGITAALTLLFGILGLLPYFKDKIPEGFDKTAASFLEVAKIFAGALVGGAAGAAATSSKR